MTKILLFLFSPLTIIAQSNKSVTIDSYMQAQVGVKQFNGAVLVAQKGKKIYRKAFGMADMEWGIPNTTKTRFRIGSNTKQFTAACILKLAEQGKLTVDDRLSKYFPDYPNGDSVTIHMLLSHTSGITNYTDLDEFWNKSAFLKMDHDSLIALFKNKPFDFSPGTKCSYSNSGYYLLGRIIEKISGDSYSNYIENKIIKPVGLANTRMDSLDTILPFRAKGYYQRKSVFYNAGHIDLNGVWSAGGLYSTIDDLYQWTKALHEDKIVDRNSKNKMITIYGITDAQDQFGYGLIIDSVVDHPRIWHDGGIPGFTSYVAYYPKDDAYIIALSNSSFDAGDFGNGLSHVLFGLPIELPYFHKEIKLTDSMLNRFVGKYKSTTQFGIIYREGKLYRKSLSGREIELKPESETKLFYGDNSDRQISFIFNKEGQISKVLFISSGISTEIKKEE